MKHAFVLLLAMVLAGCTSLASKGTMPPAGPNGELDPNQLPDFVAVAGPETGPGYIAKQAVLPGGEDRTWPVYADDLVTVLGQMVPGRGFVPAGVDPATVPTFSASVAAVQPAATQSNDVVGTYVRNGGAVEAWTVVLTGGTIQHGGAGFPPGGYIGVACLQVPVGSEIVLLDRSPTEPGAQAKQTIYLGIPRSQPVNRWVDVDADGTATLGAGIPPWWNGEQLC